MNNRLSRRRLVSAVAALGSLMPAVRLRAADGALEPTPAMTEGPFYPESWPAAPRAALVAGSLQAGVPLALAGSVRDLRGRPVGGARVEIWQCDGLGRYRHSRDGGSGGADPAFLGFGWVAADPAGRWSFETIRPVPYPGRTPHIHLAVVTGEARRLVTQIFIDGEPGNARDGLWRWLPEPARRRVTIPVTAAADGSKRQAGQFDVVLRG